MNIKLNILKSAGFLVTVSMCFGQPIITNQPHIQAAAPGGTATFTVAVSSQSPPAYQWQRNPGAGYADLAERTNAVLTLTNVQPWDAAYYRAVVTNSSGVRTSAEAYLYVQSPAMRTNRDVIDNFDDGILTGWNKSDSNGRVQIYEANGQFTVWGYWPGAPATILDRYAKGKTDLNPHTLVEGQRLERRVDLIHMSETTTLVNNSFSGDNIDHGYALTFGRGWVAILKWLPGFAVMALDPVNLPDANVVLCLALTRVQGNLLITARVLQKNGQEEVLFEKNVWDTPSVDPTFSSKQFYGVTGLPYTWLADVSRSPWFKFDYLDLEIVNFNDNTKPAEVTFDNCEVWTYRLPITRYVDAASASPAPPYTNWATAAANIQAAVDVAVAGDEIIVTNGLYSTGGRAVGTNVLVNRVAVDKPLTLRSVNGPQFTIIQGYQLPGTTNGDGAIRCAYLSEGASLSGFTLTNGATRTDGDYKREQIGGGVWCESTNSLVSTCVITGNSAGSEGGGAYQGTLNNCTLTGNSAKDRAGGVSGSTLNNCIVYFNTAATGANYDSFSNSYIILNYCCTTPMPSNGVGNITNPPLFVDYVGGNLRLQANSPCINAGLNAYAPSGTDMDGNPRIVSGTVDIGAYEFQVAGSVISYAWLQQCGLPTDGSADFKDPDHDGMNSWQEWRCQTDPTNALSALRMLSASPVGNNVTVTWQSVAGVRYFLERATNLSSSPHFTPMATYIPGQSGKISYTDTNSVPLTPLFYRVGVSQ